MEGLWFYFFKLHPPYSKSLKRSKYYPWISPFDLKKNRYRILLRELLALAI